MAEFLFLNHARECNLCFISCIITRKDRYSRFCFGRVNRYSKIGYESCYIIEQRSVTGSKIIIDVNSRISDFFG